NENKNSISRISWDFAHKQIFGIEINDRIARIAMMDMIIHEDGHSNIECNNALLDFDKFDKVRDIRPNKYSIVFTNPPFGAIVKDKIILNKFELGKGRKSQKTEILFIERCLELLKEGGKLGIVIPDSILTNSTLQYVREYILKNSKIVAIISLPQHAFSPSGAGVKASLLFLEKGKTQTKNYKVFMAVAKHIGFDSTRREDSNDLPDILLDWRSYLSGNANRFKKSFLVEIGKITYNFSPEKHINYFKNNSNWEVKTFGEITETIFTGKTPARNAYTTKGHKIIKVRDLTGKGIDWDNEDRGFVSSEFFRKNKNIQLKINDILIISAAHHPKYIGQKVDIIDYIPERFKDGVLCSAEILVVRINKKNIDPYYVLLYLKSESGYKTVQSCIRGQTAHIYPKDIKEIKIPIPPQEEYDKMKFLIEKLKQTLKMKTKANEEHRKIVNELMVNFKEGG
ncbi:N-6 DNA methylase, partial [Peptococcaceae bacterium]|nr:N-6 DNA methylase [Peptococcaceae bacterium]